MLAFLLYVLVFALVFLLYVLIFAFVSEDNPTAVPVVPVGIQESSMVLIIPIPVFATISTPALVPVALAWTVCLVVSNVS